MCAPAQTYDALKKRAGMENYYEKTTKKNSYTVVMTAAMAASLAA